MKFLDALAGKNQGRPPVWLMRQAGRYLPEYRALRAKWSLKDLFFTPELAAQVTMLPIDLLGVDAAILFSDITITALALGLKLDFREGPVVTPIITPDMKLPQIDVREVLAPIGQTIQILRQSLKVPLIGFCGAPFTVATYLVEDYKQWPEEKFLKLLDQVATATEASIRFQIESGAQAIQIFDSWANTLSREQFLKFCLPYIERLVKASSVPTIVFMRQAATYLDEWVKIGPTALSLDEYMPMHLVRKKVGPRMVLQGNIDPDTLYQPTAVIQEKVRTLIRSMQGDPGFILNLGHGMKPDMSVEAARVFLDEANNQTLMN